METSKIAVANPLKLYVNIYKTPCESQRYRIEIDYNNGHYEANLKTLCSGKQYQACN